VTNTAFIVTRSVYNVVPYGKVSVEGTQEYKIFNGATSEICKNPDTIAAMGFIPLATATPAGSSNCGYIENRDGDAVVKVTATVSAEFAQVKAGVDESVDITLDSNPFAGAGSALFYGSGDSYASALNADPVAIDAGDYRGTYTATVNAAAGTTVSFKGKFTPTDTSVVSASDKSAAVNVKAVNAYTVTLNDIPSRVATGAAVPVTATVAAGTGGALVGGTISLVDGNGAVLAEKYLPKRATKADFSWTAVAGTTNLAVVFEPDNSSLGLVATSDAQDVYASAAVTKATVTTVATTPVVWGTKTGYFGKVSITSTGVPTIKVALAAAGTLKPTGTVKVLISTSKTGGTALTLAPATVAADGTVTVTLPKVNKWRVTGATSGGLDRYLNVVYSGDTNFYGNTTSLKISVTT
jgi:hypothetical protein